MIGAGTGCRLCQCTTLTVRSILHSCWASTMSKESPRLGLQPKTPTDGRFSLLNRNDDGAKSLDRPDAGDNRDISDWETSWHGYVQLIQSSRGQSSPQNDSVGPANHDLSPASPSRTRRRTPGRPGASGWLGRIPWRRVPRCRPPWRVGIGRRILTRRLGLHRLSNRQSRAQRRLQHTADSVVRT